jgi:hypothetical protein
MFESCHESIYLLFGSLENLVYGWRSCCLWGGEVGLGDG